MIDVTHGLSRFDVMLVLQFLAGAGLFFGHGLPKLRDFSKTLVYFRKNGYGAFGAVWTAAVEGVCSVLLALAVFPRVMAALVGVTMLVAMSHNWKDRKPFEGWENAYLYFIAAVIIVLAGVSPWGITP